VCVCVCVCVTQVACSVFWSDEMQCVAVCYCVLQCVAVGAMCLQECVLVDVHLRTHPYLHAHTYTPIPT